MIDRGRIGNLMGSLCLSILLMGLGQGVAHAQTKLVQPLTGSIVISRAGSYFLASNLKGLLGLPTIDVKVSNVTINLNGFSIIGPGGTGTATGINTRTGLSGITIVNGTITRIHGTAIVLGSSSTVGGVQIINNGGDGIQCPSACLLTDNVVSGNTGTGLNFGADTTSGYQNNILTGNGTNVTGGINLGHNVCGSSLC